MLADAARTDIWWTHTLYGREGFGVARATRSLPTPPRVRNRPGPPLARLQKLMLGLSDNWDAYRLFAEQADVPATNNATERAMLGSGKGSGRRGD